MRCNDDITQKLLVHLVPMPGRNRTAVGPLDPQIGPLPLHETTEKHIQNSFIINHDYLYFDSMSI